MHSAICSFIHQSVCSYATGLRSGTAIVLNSGADDAQPKTVRYTHCAESLWEWLQKLGKNHKTL